MAADPTATRPLPLNIRRINPERKVAPTAPTAKPVPVAPGWLDDAARAEWLRLAPSLAADWRPQYEDALAAYCILWSQFKANPGGFGAPRLGQMRAMQNSLALNPRSHRLLMDASSGKR